MLQKQNAFIFTSIFMHKHKVLSFGVITMQHMMLQHDEIPWLNLKS